MGNRKHLRLLTSTALTVLCGLVVWHFPFGERWQHKSYDWLFPFASRPVTNHLVILFMDNHALARTGQSRTQAWDRMRHAALLNRLSEDRCPISVFDAWFGEPADSAATDLALGQAMKRLSNVVLMAWPMDSLFQPDASRPGVYSIEPLPPLDLFLDAVGTNNWGVGTALTNRDGVVRQHWPFPSPGRFESLPWAAAKVAGARLSAVPVERWIRYYEPGSAWESLSYVDAETRAKNYFSDKIVFIGNKPKDDLPNGDPDEFSTPFTRATSGAVGGVEILATEFLNLINDESLRRPARWIEGSVLILTGGLLAGMLLARGRKLACVLAAGTAGVILIAAVLLTHLTNYWFPWLIIAGGQVPVALAFALAWPLRAANYRAKTIVIPAPSTAKGELPLPRLDDSPDVPDYELVQPPFGHGAYGRVWLARNAVGQWQALKAVYRDKFGDDISPYIREFRGIESYKRVSDKHPGLLRIDFVSRMKLQGYFYYVMELGDATLPGWEENPIDYKPLDLNALCVRNNGRLPVIDCVRIALKLCDALEFLHSQRLAHRDIKPRNIIFVNGQPKLADVGLVADAHRPASEITWVGTPGYMPPEPEPPGTPLADIYGLGMVLYVISTGCKPAAFPELSVTLVDRVHHPEFHLLSPIICKACAPDKAARYASVAELKGALSEIEQRFPH